MCLESYSLILAGIITAAGVAGGWMNYLQAAADYSKIARSPQLEGAVPLPAAPSPYLFLLSSTIAAFIVPLFLKTIGSDMLDQARSQPLSLFVIAGFCLVASVSSKAFVQSISDRVLKEAQSATKTAEGAANAAQTATKAAEGAAKTAQQAQEHAKEAKDDVVEARGQAASLANQAVLASAVAATPESGKTVLNNLDALIAEYNTTRKEPRGPERTGKMTGIFRRMMETAANMSEFPVAQKLASNDNGDRLAAYAFLNRKPDPKYAQSLLDAIRNREKETPFGGYWGIRTIGVVMQKMADADKPSLCASLQEFLRELTPGTDRHFELQRILKDSCSGA